MFLLGHVGITGYAGHRLRLSVKVVVLAVVLPDLVDKPLALTGVGSGRYLGHSLLFVLAVSLLFALFRRRWGLSALFGGCLHLLEDVAGFVPWLYPLRQYSPPEMQLSLAGAYFNAWGLGADLIGGALLFWVAWETAPGLRHRMRRLTGRSAIDGAARARDEGHAESKGLSR